MNLHETLMELSKRHKRMKGGGYTTLLTFNHKTKTIKNGKRVLVENGKIIPQTIAFDEKEIVLEDDWGLPDEDFYSGMEKRFDDYYSSIPTEHDKFVKSIFRTKPLNKYVSYEEMMNTQSNRDKARYELEWFYMASSVNGKVVWDNPNHYFWKSPNNKLIIYKEEALWR